METPRTTADTLAVWESCTNGKGAWRRGASCHLEDGTPCRRPRDTMGLPPQAWWAVPVSDWLYLTDRDGMMWRVDGWRLVDALHPLEKAPCWRSTVEAANALRAPLQAGMDLDGSGRAWLRCALLLTVQTDMGIRPAAWTAWDAAWTAGGRVMGEARHAGLRPRGTAMSLMRRV